MNPTPLTKLQDILNKLLPYMDQRTQLDALTLRRYKKEAEANIGFDPFLGYRLMQRIAVLEWDEAGVDAYSKNAIRIRDNVESRGDYSVSLQLLGKFVEASEQAIIASEYAPTDLSHLHRAIGICFNAGMLRRAGELCETYNLRSPLKHHDYTNAITDASAVLEKIGVDEAIVVECNRIAFSLLRERKIPYSHTYLETDAGDETLMFFVRVDRATKEIEELDVELGDRLFEKVSEFHPGKYWVGYAKDRTAE